MPERESATVVNRHIIQRSEPTTSKSIAKRPSSYEPPLPSDAQIQDAIDLGYRQIQLATAEQRKRERRRGFIPTNKVVFRG